MTRVRNLKNAPITEGLIDIRASVSRGIDLSALATAHKRIEPEYVNKGQIVERQVSVELNAEAAASAKTLSRDVGYRYHSQDEKYVAQFQLNGFTLSRLAPYESWENLCAEARKLWSVYADVASPEMATRVATRFINNLRLPMRQGDRFEEYLAASPQVPLTLPQSMLAFLQRLVIYNPELEANANITLVWQPGLITDSVPVIFDIDVYRETQFSPRGTEMWDYLSELRAFKNRIFFDSLTDKALALYE